ncbi:MAG TPA: FlgD immunoglobulin-like domain containing protein [Candidatus Krumholzibacteria bacterium]|nr:FlgD immunoglobulin-like domain containing protein [Candidatus Krumholzibacteria bacterium]
MLVRETHSNAILHTVDPRCVVSWKGAARRRASAAVVAAVLALAARDAGAQCAEQQFQNYTGTNQVACPCFAPNEQAGVVFTLPANQYPIEIVKVGIAWGSAIGGTGQSIEEALHVYAGGLPNPGAPIFSLVGPVLNDGFFNEFNLDAFDITIASGPFMVALEFLNNNAGDIFAASVVHDGNGCQAGKNAVYSNGWFNACALGVTGDWVFYVKYRSLAVTGGASPVRTLFSDPPLATTSCDTVYVVNNGCDDLVISSVTGCGSAPFSIDTTPTANTIAPGGSTPILVCVTPTGATTDSCLVSVTSNASNSPFTFRVVLDVTATDVDSPALDGFDIVGVVPNPFNPSTSVRFTLPSALPVSAEVWSVTGAKVRTLADGATLSAGEHALRWDGRNANGERVASGVYMFRVSTPLGKRVARMVLVQ